MHVGKKADQPRGYRPVYLRLCFHKFKKKGFLMMRLKEQVQNCVKVLYNEHAKFKEEKESSIVRF